MCSIHLIYWIDVSSCPKLFSSPRSKSMSTTKNDAPKTVRLGASGFEVFPIALGCMGMSGAYGEADEAEGVATIQEAIDRGVTLLDTGDFYGMGHNELLIRR